MITSASHTMHFTANYETVSRSSHKLDHSPRGRFFGRRAYEGPFGAFGKTKLTSGRPCSLIAKSQTGSSMAPELKQAVTDFLDKHKVVLFMKGTRQFPQCGFSNTCVQILNVMSVPYETVNVLEDDSLRFGMKEFSQWPTFPQVYVNSEFIGGCDIMIEAYQDGSLKEMLEVAVNS